VVFLDRGVPSIKADAVVVDSQRAAHWAVSHLIRLGHRRIAIVAERDSALSAAELQEARFGPADVFPSLQRLIGWAAAFSAAGLPVLDEMILRCAYDRTAVASETAAALRRGDPPTAIFTTDGIMTLGAVDGIVDAGRAIPDDVSIVAFDDLDWTTLVRPQLTVVAQPVYELGAAATTRLLDRLAGDDGPPRTVVLDTSFIVRGSTRRPAQAILGRAV
jgi:LacI family transcriptional regulator